ncbi:MAG: hypothetical protein ACI4EX_02060 [Lachnospiraceae bacterium]
MNKVSFLIRKITIPPVWAILLLLMLYYTHPAYFLSVSQLIWGLIFLGILPILGYPLQKYIPHFKKQGREGQRSLAMLFSVLGYLLGIMITFTTKSALELRIVYLEYMLCGVLMLLFNKAFHLKASGHACGIMGPIMLLIEFRMYLPAIMGLLFSVPVMIASIRTRRHTVPQLIGGCMIAIFSMVIIHFSIPCFSGHHS